jgi:hypothetical protein
MLLIPDTWISFADHYLAALDEVAGDDQTKPARGYSQPKDWIQRNRAGALAEWHDLLLQKLLMYEANDRLDRLAHHVALAGPELGLVQARGTSAWRSEAGEDSRRRWAAGAAGP